MQQAVDERLVRNYDVYSVLQQGANMPVGPRPDVVMTTHTKKAHPFNPVMLLAATAAAYLAYKAFKKRTGRGR